MGLWNNISICAVIDNHSVSEGNEVGDAGEVWVRRAVKMLDGSISGVKLFHWMGYPLVQGLCRLGKAKT